MHIKYPIMGIVALVGIFSPVAVNAQVENDSGLWLALFAQDDLRGKEGRWRWWLDSHLRFLEDADGLNQSIVRPGVGWKLSDKMTGWAGYAWIHNRTLLGAEFDEHRAWQQLTWSASHQSWSLLLRPRLEQRFVETGDDVGLRFRQFFRLQRQLPAFPRLSLVTWDELFFHCNDTDWGARSGFDQNRVFVGLGIKSQLGSRMRTEIGYLNQSIDNASNPNRSHHNLAINFFY